MAIGNGFKFGLDTVDIRTLDFIHILVQKAETKNSQSIRIGFQFLNDQVVVLTGFDIGAIFPNGMTNGLVGFFVFLFHGLNPVKLFGATFHGQLNESIPGT